MLAVGSMVGPWRALGDRNSVLSVELCQVHRAGCGELCGVYCAGTREHCGAVGHSVGSFVGTQGPGYTLELGALGPSWSPTVVRAEVDRWGSHMQPQGLALCLAWRGASCPQ